MPVVLLVQPVSAQQAAEPIQRPAYQFRRYDEGWSLLRGVPDMEKTDFWDHAKYIPLSEDEETWLSTGGHLRLRFEGWNNFGFGAAPNHDDTFLLWRFTAHADLHVGRSFRAFVEGKTAYSTDRDLAGGNSALFRDPLALEQAFIDVVVDLDEDRDLTFRPGRQVLQFGKERLVSPLPWLNTLRRWDGLSAIYGGDGGTATAFATWFAPTQTSGFNDTNTDLPFWGLYATSEAPGSDMGLDLYYLGYGNQMSPTWNGTTGDETRHTVGTRVFARPAETGWDLDAEFAYQFGEVGSGDVSAYMFGGELGYTFAAGWSPRVFAGFDVGSGDNSAGGNVNTFNQLYPLGHAFLGFIDTIGRQNVVSPSLGVMAVPAPGTTLSLKGYHFWRESVNDGLYNAGGVQIRPGSAGSSSSIGSELDLAVRHRFDRHTVGIVGYSHFFAGDFIKESGASDDIDWVWVQMQYTF
jgi:hypothetical protein